MNTMNTIHSQYENLKLYFNQIVELQLYFNESRCHTNWLS